MQHTVHAVPAPGRFSKRAVGLLAAGLLQAGMVWALIEGLDVKLLPTISGPVHVIFDRTPVKPPPVPPQQRTVTPPPVYVPVPPIEIVGGDAGDGTAITPTTTQLQPLQAGPNDHGPMSLMATHTIPPYPPMDARLGNQGIVFLRLQIGPDGSVLNAKVLRSSGAEGLDRAALSWVAAHWRYQPAIRGGVAVPSAVDVAVKFDLKNAG